MYKNYLKVAIRNLLKNKSFTAINILGLSMGLMVAILVFLYVKGEKSYESHTDGYEQIYRTGIQANMMGQVMDAPVSPSPMAHAFRTEFPEVITATRINPVRQEIMIQHKDNKIYIENGVYADSCFFKVFNYEFIHGDPETALVDLNTMVITETTAKKFFGDENPMGKILNYDTRQDYTVTGVVKEVNGKTHMIDFDMFMSANAIDDRWLSNGNFTYVKVKKGQNAFAFTAKVNETFLPKIEPEVIGLASRNHVWPNPKDKAYFELIGEMHERGYSVPCGTCVGVMITLELRIEDQLY